MTRGPIITIDGPAGAGKSSISRALAQRLSYNYIDTGAMFRGVALAAQQASIPWEEENTIATLLPQLQIEFRQVDGASHLFLQGKDVESQIRHPSMGQGASIVSAHRAVRSHLLKLQRDLGAQGHAILEGRDTGTVVFPQADFKFYLDASSRHRALRRFQQMGSPADIQLDELQAQIEARDLADQQRKIAPLRCPDDAYRLDTSELSQEEVLQTLLKVISPPPR